LARLDSTEVLGAPMTLRALRSLLGAGEKQRARGLGRDRDVLMRPSGRPSIASRAVSLASAWTTPAPPSAFGGMMASGAPARSHRDRRR
jgi:hypothetical protein